MWVVILFTEEDDRCPGGLEHCPMAVHGFDTRDEAIEFASTQPAWTHPHSMLVTDP